MKVWFHIGGEKTGSTALQWSMSQGREALAASGVLYPRALGEVNHVLAYVYASEGGVDELKGQFGVQSRDDLAALRIKVRQELGRELAQRTFHTAVVSNEHLSSRLAAPSELECLRDLFRALDPDASFGVIYYARPQWDLIASSYSTHVKTGGTLPLRDPVERFAGRVLSHYTIVKRWAGVFGAENCFVVPYESGNVAYVDVLSDFAGRTGLPALPVVSERRNPRLTMGAAEFMRRINELLPRSVDNKFNPLRGNLQELMEAVEIGEPLRVGGGLQEAVAERYREENALLANEFLQGGPLFTHQPDPHAPDQADMPLSLDDALTIFVACWSAKQKQVIELRRAMDRLRQNKSR